MPRRVLPLLTALALFPGCAAVSADVQAPSAERETGVVDGCWIETRAFMGFTASALLVKHPEGDLLIDAGNSSHFADDIEPFHGKDKAWLRVFPGSLRPRRPLAETLARAGQKPEDLNFILASHAHLDHLGGAVDLPGTPVLLGKGDVDRFDEARRGEVFGVMPAHVEAVEERVVPIAFKDEPYEGFAAHRDLFGDGSIVIVPMAGHTPGSVGVFVHLADGQRIFHVGDAVNWRKEVRRRRWKGPGLRRTDDSPGAVLGIVAQLHALAERAPEIRMLPAHDRAAWRTIFGKPARKGTCAALRRRVES